MIAIRDAIRALVMVCIERRCKLVFGGHPAITPMIRLQFAQTGTAVGEHMVLYQSRYFQGDFPQDNAAFEHVVLVDAVENDREASLKNMREAMLAKPFKIGIFVGGWTGSSRNLRCLGASTGCPGLSHCLDGCRRRITV